MSIQESIAPYINRFAILHEQKACVRVELNSTNGKIVVNFVHDLGDVKQHPPQTTPLQSYNNVLKRNYGHHDPQAEALKKNTSPSQIKRLQRRALERSEKAKHEAEQVKANIEAEKATSEQEQSKAEKIKL